MTWIILTLVSLILSGFFSGVEIAFITADRVRIGLDTSRGGLLNRIVARYYSHQEFFISTILVGNNIMLVIYGMAFSLVGGFILGMATTKIIEFFFSCVDRKRGNRVCVVLQDICACALSFLHGAQDGQKFMSIGLLGIALAFGMETSGAADFPLWLMVICSLAMSLGTLLGGKRIIKSVAMDMVSLEKYQGVAASVSTVITLFVASMTGMPVSTSHCSTASIMGVGASRSFRRVNWGVARRMVWAWVLTFPCCGFIGWALAKLLMLF